jgi:hypothetical protein
MEFTKSAIIERIKRLGCDPAEVLADLSLNARYEKDRIQAATVLYNSLVEKETEVTKCPLTKIDFSEVKREPRE